MSNEKNTDVSGELGMLVIFGVIAFMFVTVVLPITLLSLPLAIMLRVLLDEEKPLISYSFGLLVGAIFYLFMIGLNIYNFDGLLFRSFGSELNFVFNELMIIKPTKLNFFPDFPNDIRW